MSGFAGPKLKFSLSERMVQLSFFSEKLHSFATALSLFLLHFHISICPTSFATFSQTFHCLFSNFFAAFFSSSTFFLSTPPVLTAAFSFLISSSIMVSISLTSASMPDALISFHFFLVFPSPAVSTSPLEDLKFWVFLSIEVCSDGVPNLTSFWCPLSILEHHTNRHVI